MRKLVCDCGNRLFFENTHCLNCGREVSWCPVCDTLTPLEAEGGDMRCTRCHTALWECANRVSYDVCNRSVLAPPGGETPEPILCDCCRYNDTIPDLSVEGNLDYWRKLEQAKRRLIYTLDQLGLPRGAAVDGFVPGLSFDFKGDAIPADGRWRSMGQEKVYTGHDGGKITINVREADEVEREKMRVDLGEGHRTLIGHFRHEIGHFYWDVLIRDRPEAETRFKTLFGDPWNPTYADALQQHYNDGPPPGWQQSYISAYATMHPWEDWAETFAFYLDLVDVLDTAAASGLVAPPAGDSVQAKIKTYTELGILLNELNRSMGLIDFLPEIVAPAIIPKIEMVQDTIIQGARNATPEAVSPRMA